MSDKRLKILIDCHIPLIKGLLDQFAEVVYLEPSEFTSNMVKDADALIIRTRTHCNAELLDGSSVKFIATATIGYDHIDTEYCKTAGIEWTNAPGCNSWSVANYIDAAIRYAMPDFKGKTLGVVGVGHVGSKVYAIAKSMDMNVIACDPPREQRGDTKDECGASIKFTDIETIAKEADIITFHVPLDSTTHHLINGDFLRLCKSNAIIMNAARGAVLCTDDALKATQKFVIDCWEGEPTINKELLDKAIIATPHIAGYSIDGKANGTLAAANAVSRFFNLGAEFNITMLGLPKKDYSKPYLIENESEALKQTPEKFEWFRNNYPIRRDLLCDKKRYFIHLAYNGEQYHGWQYQPNGISVQEAIERALGLILKEKIAIVGAGRTDAGVHARCMYAHFSTAEKIDGEQLTERLNKYLPQDIVIYSIKEVGKDMHARFSAKSRLYRYYVTTEKDPFNGQYRMKVNANLDFETMNKACQILFKYTDFTSFSKLHTDVKTNNCHIMEAHWDQTSDIHWVFTIKADRFLRNMVRAIVGTLLEVGKGKMTLERFAEIIEKKDRCFAGTSAPAKALFLEEVNY